MPPKTSPQVAGQGSGHATLAIVGTGLALLRPLRCKMTFNGLTLNDLSVIDKYRIQRVEGMDDPDVKDDREELAGMDGEVPLDAFYKGRTLSLVGRIEAHTPYKLDDMREALARGFGPLVEQELRFVDPLGLSRDYYIMCRKSSKIVWADELKDYNYYTDFMIPLRASNPRKLKVITAVWVDPLPNNTIMTNRVVFSPGNQGSATAQPVIRLTGGLGGTITVRNNTNGQQFQISGGVAAGTWIEINTAKRTVKNQLGASVKSKFSGQYIEYEPGQTNQILLSTTAIGSGAPEISTTHQDSYL
jgi:hypothetical protein